MHRVGNIARHIQAGATPVAKPLEQQPVANSFCSKGKEKADDDVVICCSIRTAVGKARGIFKDTPCEDLLAPLFKTMVERTKIDPKKIGDCQIGNVLQPGAGAVTARMSQFLAGLPVDVPVCTLNRQCSSSLSALAIIGGEIRSGVIDVGLAGGVESMSMYNMMESVDINKLSDNILDNKFAADCLLPMGITSENVAAKWAIPREKQDRLAEASHLKALAAQKNGLFDSEIVPITVNVKDKKTGKVNRVTVSKDEGPRAGTTLEKLSKLKPVFRAGGSTTAGNASQTSDGASLALVARRSVAKELGLPIIARLLSFAVVGVEPDVMGIGPAFAIPVALEKAGLSVSDIDIYEINEAFASQATMSVEHLGIPLEKVNPKGGAIALGHPLGCTGTRQLATLLPELKRQGKKYGVMSMCLGTGMGAAGVVESEQ